jgi:hypothetical protein
MIPREFLIEIFEMIAFFGLPTPNEARPFCDEFKFSYGVHLQYSHGELQVNHS